MLVKYNVWDEDAEEVIPEIATFSRITYDKEKYLCYLILAGDNLDVVIFQMSYLDYRCLIDKIFWDVNEGKNIVEIENLVGIEEDYEYEESEEKHLKILQAIFDTIKKHQVELPKADVVEKRREIFSFGDWGESK